MSSKLDKSKEFVRENFDKLLNLYRNKYILVYNNEVVGSFDNYETAAEEGIRTYGLNSGFFIQLMSDSTPVNFLSLAAL